MISSVCSGTSVRLSVDVLFSEMIEIMEMEGSATTVVSGSAVRLGEGTSVSVSVCERVIGNCNVVSV